MSGCSRTSSSSRNARGGEGDRELRRVPERLAAHARHARGQERGYAAGPDRRPRDDVGVVGVGPEARARRALRARHSAGGRCPRPTPASPPSSATAAPSAADASATPVKRRPRRQDDPVRRERQRVQHHAERPRIRRSGDERRRRAHRDRQALLRRPRRDRDPHVLVVDAVRVGERRARRRRRRRDRGWAAPPARAPRTRTSRSQSTCRSISARSIVSVSPSTRTSGRCPGRSRTGRRRR